jgi:4-hydroxybenzoyl-CoA thioesterase/acyl-CoA thioester hydrolase
MSVAYKTSRRVEFGDTDLGGIVYFPNYFKYMEAAEHRFLESLGFPPHREHEGMLLGWPRVSASCDFASPLRYGDEVEIAISIQRRGEKSISYEFHLSVQGRHVAKGAITTVCIDGHAGAPLKAMPIPPALASKLDALV